MTPEQLIAEGRRLQRPCVFLRPQGTGLVAAVWHERDHDEIDRTGEHCWLTVDSSCVPGLSPSVSGLLSIFTDDVRCQGGRVEVVSSWPERRGTPLHAHAASVLPPIDAVFARGSDAVGEWLALHGWNRDWGFNNNFKGREIIWEYERVWQDVFPLFFESDVYAVLGGWHFPGPDDDWHDLVDEHLMVLTIRDSEPWVEAWLTRTGEFRVIQRIT